MIKFRLKSFSMYDDTDVLKGMKDSDILSQEKRKSLSAKGIGTMAVAGGTTLGVAGALGNSLLGRTKGQFLKGFGTRLAKGGKTGALLGIASGIGAGLIMKGKQNNAEKIK